MIIMSKNKFHKMTRRGEENKKGSKMKTKDKQFMKEKMRKEGKGEEKKKEN